MSGVDGVAQSIVLVGAAVGALLVIASFVRKVGGKVRMMIEFAHRVEKALVNVEGQLYPNGGASLRDAVNRLQAALGVPNIPSKGKSGDQLAAAVRPDRPAPVVWEPPSTVLHRLDALETRSEAEESREHHDPRPYRKGVT